MNVSPSRVAFAFFLKTLVYTLATGIATVTSVVAAASQQEETPKEVIAAQLRRQGYTCDNPVSAKRDQERSKPDQPVWILKCEKTTYRVRLTPDMAADVVPLD
jgi:hypothetical protein